MERLNLKNIITVSRRKLVIGAALILGAAAWGASVVHLPPVVTSGVQVTGATASMAAVFDASKNLGSSAVTSTELGYVSGVTSSLCGINQSCTLTNKALTSPSMSNPAVTGALSLPDGTVSAPSLTFTSETNSGLYRIGAKDVGLSIDGVLGLEAVKDSSNTYTNLGVGGAANTDPQYLLQASRTLNGSAFLVGLNFSNGAAAEVGNRFINAQSHAGDVILTAGAYSETNIADRLVLEGRGTAGVTIAADQSSGTIDSLIGGYASTNLVTKVSSWGQYVNGAMSIGTTSPNASAILDLTSTTKGFLPPRMTSTQKGAIVSPAEGLSAWDTTNHIPWSYDGTEWVATSVPYASVGNTGYVLKSGGGSVVNSWSNSLDAFTLTNMNTNYGTASNTQRLVLPSASTSTLSGLTNTAALIAYDSTQGKPVFNNGSGWTTIGTGSGGGSTNFIGNPDAESGTTGWATYADAAAATPVDGTGGSPTVTWTQSSSSPLTGTDSFLFTKDAANRQGQGASYGFTIDSASKARVMQISFDYQVASGTFVAGSSSTDSDIEVYIYDVTNAQIIQPSTYKLYSSTTSPPAHFVANFQTASNSTSYRLIFHVATTSASAYTVQFDSVTVAPSTYTYGTPITDWQSYTPTITGFGTPTNVSFRSRRVGDSLEVNGFFNSGSSTAVASQITLGYGGVNANVTIDSSKISATALVGGAQVGAASTTIFGWSVLATGANNYIGLGAQTSTLGANAVQNGSAVASSGNAVEVNFRVPILGWSSSVQMSDNASQRVVAFANAGGTPTGTLNSSFNKVTYPGAATVKDTLSAYSAPTYTVQVPGQYAVSAGAAMAFTGVSNSESAIAIYQNGTKKFVGDIVTYGSPGSTSANPVVVGILDCKAGDTIEIYALNSNTSPTFVASSSASYFNIFLIQGNQTIAATETQAAKMVGTSGATYTSGNTTIVPYSTVSYDYNGLATTGSSAKMTAQVAGLYEVCGGVSVNGGTTTNGNAYQLFAYDNGSLINNLAAYNGRGAAESIYLNGCIDMKLNAADAIDIRFSGTFASGTLTFGSSTTGLPYFTFKRIGL